jgi:hypothetical protein
MAQPMESPPPVPAAQALRFGASKGAGTLTQGSQVAGLTTNVWGMQDQKQGESWLLVSCTLSLLAPHPCTLFLTRAEFPSLTRDEGE